MRLNESAENYLETILILQKQNGNVRSIDIANELSFSKPSVSVAMKNFKELGYIDIGKDKKISLTDMGLKIAEDILERHQLIAELLMLVGVDEETAYDDSCKIEHFISEKSVKKIKDYLASNRPRASRSGDIDVVLL